MNRCAHGTVLIQRDRRGIGGWRFIQIIQSNDEHFLIGRPCRIFCLNPDRVRGLGFEIQSRPCLHLQRRTGNLKTTIVRISSSRDEREGMAIDRVGIDSSQGPHRHRSGGIRVLVNRRLAQGNIRGCHIGRSQIDTDAA